MSEIIIFQEDKTGVKSRKRAFLKKAGEDLSKADQYNKKVWFYFIKFLFKIGILLKKTGNLFLIIFNLVWTKYAKPFILRNICHLIEDGRLGRRTILNSGDKIFAPLSSFLTVINFFVNQVQFRFLLLVLGDFFLLFSIIGIIFSIFPLIKQQAVYNFKTPDNKKYLSSPKNENNFLAIAPDSNFSLIIPKINIVSKVISDVDFSKEKEWQEALKKGVAHASGGVFPGAKGTTFLFAHSTNAPWNITRYNAIFYLLGELEKGDRIIVIYKGKEFEYLVVEKKITERTETSFLTQKKEELLVLQTCYPPGTTEKALLVFAKPV